MTRTLLLRFVLALATLLPPGAAALAQSAACQRYQAELAALERGGGSQAAAAERQLQEIGRLRSYFRGIGCAGGPFGFMSGPPPAECGSIAQQIRQLEANYAQLSAQGDAYGGIDARRRQLQVAVQQACAAPPVNGPRGFFESLFGPPRGQQQQPENIPQESPVEPERALGGGRLVCVRTCDGFYFPLSNRPAQGREVADEMCQALCPGTETAAFSMPRNDDALDSAVSLKGQPYTSLQNAFKFQKTFDASCACKKEGENWAQILRRAESMLDQRRGDILVTAQKSEELSRPKTAPNAARERDKKAAEAKASAAAEAQAAAEQGAAAPTAGRESSGIGPQSIENSRVVDRSEGPKRQMTTPDGTRRNVRIVAPNIIPVPETRTQ